MFRQYVKISGIAVFSALLSTGGQAHQYEIGNITIDHPWTRATPAGAKVAGGYASITNKGNEPDRLIGGSAEGAEKFEVHEMTVENDVMKMRQLAGGLEIKPGETVELKPGSYHVMMIGLAKPYKEGDSVKGALTFEKAGTVEIEFKVEAMGAKESGASDHGGHGGHGAHKGH